MIVEENTKAVHRQVNLAMRGIKKWSVQRNSVLHIVKRFPYSFTGFIPCINFSFHTNNLSVRYTYLHCTLLMTTKLYSNTFDDVFLSVAAYIYRPRTDGVLYPLSHHLKYDT